MKKEAAGAALLSLIASLTLHAQELRPGPPDKPVLTRCRSPEKETFTCWWEPGSDGGLPTTYALYYRKEHSETVYECPDYRTGGRNSCFFNKNDTSLWVNYNITVVATNALGSACSDPVDIDVVYIVKPNPPEELNVTVMEDKGWPFLRVSWEPPHKADTRSGWITLIYELRVKLDGEDEWEMHLAGQQKMFNIFSLRSGGTYQVQVRCKPDHGFWSEWGSTYDVKVPDYFHREKSLWILLTVFTAFIFIVCAWLLHMNGDSLRHYVLPPVPGPKIRGFDKRLLKNGNCEDIFSALVVPEFPPASPFACEDLQVEYLEVCIPDEQELSKDGHACRKPERSAPDNDSGRGSCDSQTLLSDKCDEVKRDARRAADEESPTQTEAQRSQKDWSEDGRTYASQDLTGTDQSSGRVKTWPSVFSPPLQGSTTALDHANSLVMAKQHFASDVLFPPGSTSPFIDQQAHGAREAQKLQAHSDVNISTMGHTQTPYALPVGYVEVQKLNKADRVLLQRVASGRGGQSQGENYSKVKSVDSHNQLLLQRDGAEAEGVKGAREEQESREAVCISAGSPGQRETPLPASGYVDTATMFTLPAH